MTALCPFTPGCLQAALPSPPNLPQPSSPAALTPSPTHASTPPPTAISVTAPPPHLSSGSPSPRHPSRLPQPALHTHLLTLVCSLSLSAVRSSPISQSLLCLGRHLRPPPPPPQAFHSWTLSLYIWFKAAPPKTLCSGHPGLGFGGLGPLWGLLASGHPGLSAKNSEYPALPWLWRVCWGEEGDLPPACTFSGACQPAPPPLAYLRGTLGLGLQGERWVRCWLDMLPTPPPPSGLRGLVSLGVSSDSEGYFTRCMILNGISTICSTP